MNVKRNLVVAVVLVAMAGCGLFEDRSGLELATDETGYAPGSSIRITATNNTSEVIYYNTCMPTTLQELSDGKVVQSVHMPTCACLCVTELKPGKSWTYDVDVTWLWQNLGVSQPKVGPNYRFLLQFFRDEDLTKTVRASDLTTNVFRFTAPAR